ncbi:unnamed protein product [Protopolystoma xenopodis]|uniref:Uncharacterized protein n=1 Tax=Protopolystoma xenopodis TaxID=117903 RepID=A0A3S5CKZ3_9PLAT|nr:unnamed protein product [Protopolystoma xenopodis]
MEVCSQDVCFGNSILRQTARKASSFCATETANCPGDMPRPLDDSVVGSELRWHGDKEIEERVFEQVSELTSGPHAGGPYRQRLLSPQSPAVSKTQEPKGRGSPGNPATPASTSACLQHVQSLRPGLSPDEMVSGRRLVEFADEDLAHMVYGIGQPGQHGRYQEAEEEEEEEMDDDDDDNDDDDDDEGEEEVNGDEVEDVVVDMNTSSQMMDVADEEDAKDEDGDEFFFGAGEMEYREDQSPLFALHMSPAELMSPSDCLSRVFKNCGRRVADASGEMKRVEAKADRDEGRCDEVGHREAVHRRQRHPSQQNKRGPKDEESLGDWEATNYTGLKVGRSQTLDSRTKSSEMSFSGLRSGPNDTSREVHKRHSALPN